RSGNALTRPTGSGTSDRRQICIPVPRRFLEGRSQARRKPPAIALHQLDDPLADPRTQERTHPSTVVRCHVVSLGSSLHYTDRYLFYSLIPNQRPASIGRTTTSSVTGPLFNLAAGSIVRVAAPCL